MTNRILVCSEFSQIGSGYAIYTHELLKAFKRRGIEFAELASFCNPTDARIKNCAWKVYPVQPPPQDKAGVDAYNSNPANPFGRQIFDSVLIDYKPTHVIDVRDVWNLVHEIVSPLREYFAHIVMPAVDSDPQHKNWVNMYSKADGIVTYCDWATKLLKEKYQLKNVYGSASPVPPAEFKPLPDKNKVKQSLGLGDVTIIGNVMRNQPRKLFPQMFKMFRRLLDETQRNDIYLYCHTSYPDVWELDELLIEHGIGHKVLFTYSCTKCGFVETSFYKGYTNFCINCKTDKSLRLPTTHHPISQFTLNQIYNLFDLYIQYAALEGYGIPIAEAISAGVPSMCVNYSAMETFIQEGNSIPIEVKEFYIEPETGRRFAIPDESDAVNKLKVFLNTPESERSQSAKLARMIYGVRDFDRNVDIWLDAINNTKPRLSWDAAPKPYKALPPTCPKNMSNELFARWLICEVLQDASYVGSYMEARLVRDLDTGLAFIGHDNKYYYEAMGVANQRHQQFNQDIAFTHFSELHKEKLYWEQQRIEQGRNK